MASFGEALSKSFVDTFGAMNRARYIGAITNRIASEQAGEDAYKADLEAQSKAHGVALPGAQPAAAPQAPAAPAPQAPAAPTPVSAIAAAQTPAAAPAAPAPQPPAAAPPAAAPPAAAPPAAAPPAAPVPAPSAMAAAQAPAPVPQAPAAPPQMGGQMGGQEGGQSPFDPQTTAKIIEFVEAAKDPVVTMVAAGAMQSGKPPQPGETQALRAQVPGLMAAVQDARGGGQREITKADWNGFLEKMTLSAMKNLTPQQQQQALGTIDKIRTVGLQMRLGVAMTAARSGDMQGAADALNGANAFLPDGYNSKFKVVNGGIQITRTAEDGKGEAATRVLTPQEIETHAMSLMDPAGTVKHLLNEKIHTEAVRHNKVTEGHAAANIGLRGRELEFNQNLRADAAKLKREQDEERKAQTERDAAGVAAYSAAQKANRALVDAEERGATPGTLRNLREAALAADEKWESSLLGMSQRGASATAALGESARANDDRNTRSRSRAEERQAAAAGRVPFTPDERKALYEQLDSFENDPANLDSNKKPTDSTLWAAAQTMPFAMANRDLPPKVIAGVLKRYHEDPKRPEQFPASITDARSGVTLRVPGAVPERNNIKPGMRPPEGNDPVAPADKPATPGAMQSMMGAAPPASPAIAAPAPRQPVDANGSMVRSWADSPFNPNRPGAANALAAARAELENAFRANPAARRDPNILARIAEQYGVDPDALRGGR